MLLINKLLSEVRQEVTGNRKQAKGNKIDDFNSQISFNFLEMTISHNQLSIINYQLFIGGLKYQASFFLEQI
jgi:hypothetical protein